VRDILECNRDLAAAKDNVDKMLVLVKEKYSRIKQKLGLF
jgi:hypothetical protein